MGWMEILRSNMKDLLVLEPAALADSGSRSGCRRRRGPCIIHPQLKVCLKFRVWGCPRPDWAALWRYFYWSWGNFLCHHTNWRLPLDIIWLPPHRPWPHSQSSSQTNPWLQYERERCGQGSISISSIKMMKFDTIWWDPSFFRDQTCTGTKATSV
jgi:hypothetical protein